MPHIMKIHKKCAKGQGTACSQLGRNLGCERSRVVRVSQPSRGAFRQGVLVLVVLQLVVSGRRSMTTCGSFPTYAGGYPRRRHFSSNHSCRVT